MMGLLGERWGGRRYPPYAFTEQGVAMLSSVLRSQRAIRVNIEIMRAFVRLRQMLASNVELARRIDELEKKYDAQFSRWCLMPSNGSWHHRNTQRGLWDSRKGESKVK